MAADTRNMLFCLIILFIIVSPCDLFSIGDVSRTLHFPKISDAERFGKNIYHMTVDSSKFVDNVDTYLRRVVRDTSSQNSTVSSSVAKLNTSLSTLIVHWAMNDSDVIIALAKDTGRSRPPASSLYISSDYGKTFQDVSNTLMVNSTHQAIIDSYKNSPLYNSHYIFSDIINNCTFRTHNFGKTFRKTCGLSFRPKIIHVHPTVVSSLLAFDDTDPQKRLFYSIDFGFSWHLLQRNVKFFFWGVTPYDKNNMTIYVEEERENDNIVIKQEYAQGVNFNHNWHRTVVLEGVEDFEVRGPYLFATKKVRLLGSHDANTLQLWVSYKRGEFQAAQFPYSHKNLDFYIADASEGQVMACVTHNESRTNLYISEVEGLKFSLSLERIVYYNPKGANKDTWISQYTNDTFADIYKVNGMRGIYVASQVKDSDLSEQVSLITYDKGGEWQLITAPAYKPDGSATNCSKDKISVNEQSNSCSLHLTQQYHHLYSKTSSSPITSHQSAPGLILAAGIIGPSLKGIPDIFVSSNAGVSWHQVLDGLYMYTLGDHGGLLVAIQQYSVTNQIFYSTNEGETWQSYKFMKDNTKIRIYGLLTEPGETTTIFSVYGSYVEKHSWLIVQVDLRSIFRVNCTKDDYKIWSLPMSTPDHGCLLGKKIEFERRIAHAPCFNGKSYVRQQTERNCSCIRDDFECDYGFKDMNLMCKTDPDVPTNQIHKIPQNCPEGTFYPYTRGYRKVAGDTCKGGDEHKYAPLIYSCPIAERREFILYTTGGAISRIDLDNNNDEMLVNAGMTDVNVIDFDYLDNCVFWADNGDKKIKKLCLGESDTRNITDVIDRNIRSINGLAYDWTAKTIYWVDGEAKRIEVAGKDGKWRRRLINSTHLDRPRSIALNPHYGFMYWTDWSEDNPRICSSWMDGTISSIKTIVSGSDIQEPSGLTVDIELERLFWTDSSKITIMSSDLYGNNRKVLVHGTDNLLHPYSIGVYKNNMYWSDWGRDAILVANKESGLGIEIVKSMLKGVTDLKVISHTSQQANGACSPGHLPCSQLCLPRPHPTVLGTQNRTCKCGDDFQHTINAATGDENCRCGHGETILNGICEMSTNSTTCSSDRFHCASGECMPLTWECDHDNDCSDGSDELNCPFSTCDSDQFTCQSGRCLPSKWHCDFDNDCGDGSDELNCEYPTCDPTKFQCDNKRCIASAWKCDFDDDCQDNSDEKGCNYTSTCRSWEFSCVKDGQCIGVNRQCDGRLDCDDGSDEQDCDVYTCSPWRFKCTNDTQCIFRTWRCDGDSDCHDGSDEEGCFNSTTPAVPTISTTPEQCSQFTCHNLFCLQWRYICNGINDCGDNSDETDCGIIDFTTTTTSAPGTCSPNDYRCNNGRCIHKSQACNGVNECGDNSDETVSCAERPVCLPNQFHCYNSSSENRQCIWDAWVCDNDNDCHNGEDEKNCDGTCTSSEDFKCRYSEGCIRKDQVCDKVTQCADGSDELGCSGSTSNSSSQCNTRYTFECMNECLVWAYICDGDVNCPDGSDEYPSRCGNRNKKIYSVRLEDITATTATVEFSSRTFQQNQSYQLSYGIEGDVTSWVNDTVSSPIYHMVNLQPHTVYLLTVYIRIGYILYNPLKVTRFTTLQGVPSTPRNVICGIDTDDSGTLSVEVTWDEPRNPNGYITTYNIYYKNINNGIERKMAVHSGRDLTFDLDDSVLTPNEVYNLTITAVNRAGESNRTAPVRFVFKQPFTDITIKIIKKYTTNTSATIVWSKVKAAVKYKLYVSLRNQALDEQREYESTTGNYTINGLCPGNDYSIRIQSVTKQGPGRLTEDSFSTNGSMLGAPSFLDVKSIGSHDVKVSIVPPTGSHPLENFTYIIYYGENKTLETDKKIHTISHQKTIHDLLSCRTYYFYVGLEKLSCPVSSVYTLTVQEDDKLRPRDLNAVVVDLNSVRLFWESPCTTVAEPLGYTIDVKIPGKPSKEIMTGINSENSTLSYLFTSLKRGTTYLFKVRTSVAASSFSDSLKVEMPGYFAVENLDVIQEKQDEFLISWVFNRRESAKHDSVLNYTVKIIREEDKDYDVTLYTTTTKVTVKFEIGYIYNISVRYMLNGLYSEAATNSFPYEVENIDEGSLDSVVISGTNLVAIVVPVCAVIVVLVVVVIALGVRHKRLQRSFTAFANSHYDTRSGTTTFSSEDLGDEDTPMIQGFSDDEPLVLA